jgi:DNA-binding winged helix-turn-helix (wHTH) protein/tetratricopeptide (TPR) repeat protein
MIPVESEARRLRFSVFEVDLQTNELHRQGRKIALQGQPFQLLAALLQRPGEVVTRDDLRREIWPAAVNVDFERGLNRAMNKLRYALGDSPQTPILIETVPRVGYRFIGTVSSFDPLPATQPPPQIEPGETSSKHTRRSWIRPFILLVFVAAVLGGWAFWKRAPAKLTGVDQLVLTEFKNDSGDPILSRALRQALAIQLRQSPQLRLLEESRVAATLRSMGKEVNTDLSEPVALEICVRTGSSATVAGSVSKLGAAYILGLRATNCATGNVVDEEQERAANREDLLKALSVLAGRFRQKAGESLASVRLHAAPLPDVTTSSLEALREYGLGRRLLADGDHADAIAHLTRAVELDPRFAMAHAHLGVELSAAGEQEQSNRHTRIAWSLRDHTSGTERFFIEFSFSRDVTGNLREAQRIATIWAQTYPADVAAVQLLSGFVTKATGDFEKGLDAANRSLVLDPAFAPVYRNLIESNIYLNRLDAAEKWLDEARVKLASEDFLVPSYYLAFFRGDTSAMNRQVAAAHANRILESEMFHHQALTLARLGRLNEAEKQWRRAVAGALELNARDSAALYRSAEAISEALLGKSAEGSTSAHAALELSDNRDVTYAAALALGLAGKTSECQRLAVELEQRFPEDTIAHFLYVPTLKARLALTRHDNRQALSELEISEPYDIAVNGTDFLGFFGGLYTLEFRGEALLDAGQPANAAIQFQKVIDHTGLVFADPIGMLARVKLASAYQQIGQMNRAKQLYGEFLKDWTSADPELKVLQTVRKQYERLSHAETSKLPPAVRVPELKDKM